MALPLRHRSIWNSRWFGTFVLPKELIQGGMRQAYMQVIGRERFHADLTMDPYTAPDPSSESGRAYAYIIDSHLTFLLFFFIPIVRLSRNRSPCCSNQLSLLPSLRLLLLQHHHSAVMCFMKSEIHLSSDGSNVPS